MDSDFSGIWDDFIISGNISGAEVDQNVYDKRDIHWKKWRKAWALIYKAAPFVRTLIS